MFSPRQNKAQSDGEKKIPNARVYNPICIYDYKRRRRFLVLTLGVILSDNGLVLDLLIADWVTLM